MKNNKKYYYKKIINIIENLKDKQISVICEDGNIKKRNY